MAFFDAPTFNPQSYGGQGGNLLDFLRSLQQQQQVQPSAGFVDRMVPVGNYQMPQFGNPDPAALPQNAMPTQGTLPAAQPIAAQPAQPDFGNRLSAGLEGFAAGPGMISKLTGLAQGLSTGQSPTNMTQQALVRGGLDPAIAQQVVRNPELLRAVLPTLMGTAGQTDDIKEYQFAKKEDPSLTFQKFMQQKKSVTGEYSLNPVYGTDTQGNTVLLQTGKGGEAIQTKLPEGVKVSAGADKIDLGTHWGIIDKRSGNLIGTQPKDIVGREAAEVRGKAQGTAQTALPNALVKSQQSLDLIDEMIKHPGRETATGLSGTLDPRNYIAGTEATDFRVRQQQMQGRTFLEAFESLRGGGAITEIEGQKAEAAIARLNTRQSDKEYLAALNELKQIITKGMQVARQKAAGNFSEPSGWQDMGGGVRIREKR